MNKKSFFQYILARLRERSTWIGVTSLMTALGLVLTDFQQEAVIAAGTAVAGLLISFTPDQADKKDDVAKKKDNAPE